MWGVLLVGAVGCGAGGGSSGDAATDESTPCSTHADCDDDVFCNGAETCAGVGAGGADALGCLSASDPCNGTQTCDEVANECQTQCGVAPDNDGDGRDAISCGGDDCDDGDPLRFPDNLETFDATHDEDCDPATFGDTDVDGDGFV